MGKDKVVLAYSGGLDTSMMLKWLQEEYGLDVISVNLDVGQGKEKKGIEKAARAIYQTYQTTIKAI